MGMFDKDKSIGENVLDAFALDEPFVLWGVDVETGITTEIGEARSTHMEASKLDETTGETGPRVHVSTLASAIADKAEQAGEDDFPAVVKLRKVRSKRFGGDALVLQYVRAYDAPAQPADPLDVLGPPAETTPARSRSKR